jgi:hypothetical protein
VAVAAPSGTRRGHLLFEHLARTPARGIRLEADVLGDNRRMLSLLAASGFKVSESRRAGGVRPFPAANDV